MVDFLLTILHFLLCQTEGSWNLGAVPSTTNGENNITLQCSYLSLGHNFDDSSGRDNKLLVEIQRNESADWRLIAMVNYFGVRLLNAISYFEKYSEPSGFCRNNYIFVQCRIRISMSFTLQQCYIDPIFNPRFRCQLFLANEIRKSREKDIFPIKGDPPKNITNPTIVLPNSKPSPLAENPLSVGDVVQLQCLGEIESTNGIASQNIRWCKRYTFSEIFEEIQLQESPRTTIVSNSSDACTYVQESNIFYHITQNDKNLHIMCESGYKNGSTECGKGSANSTLFIRTLVPQEGIWKMSPIIIYDKYGVINPLNININGTGKTVDVMCIGSAFGAIQEAVITWCVKSEEDSNWTKVVTQEKEIKTTVNNSDETMKFSRINYHIIGNKKVVNFLCEISNSTSSSCGSGLSSTNISIQINTVPAMLKEGTKIPTTQGNIALVSAVVVSLVLCVVLFLDIAFLVKAYRGEKITFFGLTFTLERNEYLQKEKEERHPSNRNQQKTVYNFKTSYKKNAEKKERQTDPANGKSGKRKTKKVDGKSECNTVFEIHSFYENDILRSEIMNKGGQSTLQTASDMFEYDELQIENEQEKYEDLILPR